MPTNLYRPMSTLQRSRRHFIPTIPKCYVDVLNTKISLVRTILPIKAELMPIFPTLLANGAEGMPNIEIVVDNENGTVLKSDKALRVSKNIVCVVFGHIEQLSSPLRYSTVRRTQPIKDT